MLIKIILPGRYAGRNLKAVTCAAGDELETGEGYGASLVADGYASVVAVAAIAPNSGELSVDPEPEKETASEPDSAPKQPKRKPAKKDNAFTAP